MVAIDQLYGAKGGQGGGGGGPRQDPLEARADLALEQFASWLASVEVYVFAKAKDYAAAARRWVLAPSRLRPTPATTSPRCGSADDVGCRIRFRRVAARTLWKRERHRMS